MRAYKRALARLIPDQRQDLLKYPSAEAGNTAGAVGLLRMDKPLVARGSSEPRAKAILSIPIDHSAPPESRYLQDSGRPSQLRMRGHQV